ncbi:MAG TPA: transcription-repair coupling factor, partial [Planctomycetaceae bacterium]|nr:transcription-repair coupling factor [Planctomycetaceae bacterium]
MVTSIQALCQPVPSREAISEQTFRVRVGEQVKLERLVWWLVEQGYERCDTVELPGELSIRGGIVDVFPPDRTEPVRIEFFGDQVDSIRLFDPETQRSSQRLDVVELPGATERSLQGAWTRAHFCEYLPPDTRVVVVEPDDVEDQAKQYLARVGHGSGCFEIRETWQRLYKFPTVFAAAIAPGSMETTWPMPVTSIERFSGELDRIRHELDTVAAEDHVLIACQNEAESRRLAEVFAETAVRGAGRLLIGIGHVRSGFRLLVRRHLRSLRGLPEQLRPLAEAPGLVLVAGHELFQRQPARPMPRRRRYESRAIDSFIDLRPGDLVVHVSHGIARYGGLKLIERSGQVEEHLVLEFADGVLLYVPASKIGLVQKYVGTSKAAPALSKLGT